MESNCPTEFHTYKRRSVWLLPSIAERYQYRMKAPLLISLLIKLLSVQCREQLIYKKDFQIFRAHDGIELKPFGIDLPSNLTDSMTHDAEFEGAFLDPKFQNFNNTSRSKREDIYSAAFEDFFEENFGSVGTGSKNSDANGSDKKAKERKPCKIIYKDGKKCTICRNPKTNAKAENCSYSSASKPKKYAFKRQRSYQNDGYDQDAQGNADDKDSSENQHNQEPKTEDEINSDHTTLETDFSPFAGNIDKVIEGFKNKDWSKCQQKRKNGAICYYCKDTVDTRNEECVYTSEESTEIEVPKKSARAIRSPYLQNTPLISDHPIREGKQIFKRTVSMKIHAEENERPLDRKSFLYAKTVRHVEK